MPWMFHRMHGFFPVAVVLDSDAGVFTAHVLGNLFLATSLFYKLLLRCLKKRWVSERIMLPDCAYLSDYMDENTNV